MVNSDYDTLKDWMFGKLTSLLQDTEPNPKYPVLKMSLGEPTLGVPDFTKKILDLNYKDWAKYPPSEAIPSLGDSILKTLTLPFTKYSARGMEGLLQFFLSDFLHGRDQGQGFTEGGLLGILSSFINLASMIFWARRW